MTKLYFFVILITGTALVETNKQQKISGEYFSYWASTVWKYQFNTNGSYIFETRGHFGDTKTIGTYTSNKDTLFLLSLPANQQPDSSSFPMTEKLFVLSDSCLVDLSTGYEYCKHTGELFTVSRKRNVKKKKMPIIKE